ncbi:tRNA pseudouridine(13) synthase TruD [Candidatus Woesearchaeota archaeon]|nr:MAG: tRNA pseudouridine(13) synthase TruD [Candidatus Woesearchaeota archaeon]
MYKIKSKPEDFHVREVIDLKTNDSGRFAYFWLKKRGLGTEEAVLRICEKCRVPRKMINYSGLKDKHAVTEQAISIRREFAGKLQDFRDDRIQLELLGFGDERINLGTHSANRFRIVVRNIASKPRVPFVFPNYFDEQRFSKNNALVGKHIINENFNEAARLLAQSEFNLERQVKRVLDENASDPVRALRQIPRRILSLYVHAYQSLIFNEILAEHVARHSSEYFSVPYSEGVFRFPLDRIPDRELPIVGFGTSRQVIEEFSIEVSPRQFIVRQIPELSSEGTTRPALINISELEVGALEEDEMNPGNKKCTVAFMLPKSSYATIVVRALFSQAETGKT